MRRGQKKNQIKRSSHRNTRKFPGKRPEETRSIIEVLAKKLVKLRLFLIPYDSRREWIYLRFLRPIIVRLLDSSFKSLTPKTPCVKTIQPFCKKLRNVKEICIVKCDHIGDFFLSLQAFSILRKGFPSARITLLCGEWNKAIAVQSGFFDRVVVVNVSNEVSSMEAPSFDPRELDAHEFPVFDIIIDLKIDLHTRFLLKYIPANFRAGFEHGDRENLVENEDVLPYLDYAFKAPAGYLRGHLNRARHAQTLLAAFSNGIINLFNGEDDVQEIMLQYIPEKAAETLIRLGSGPLVGINTGSGATTKDWPLDYYMVFIRRLIVELDATVILLGTQRQRSDADKIKSKISSDRIIDLVHCITLQELPGIINQLDIYVGHDTGGTHLAALLKKNVVCLYAGVGPIEAFSPVGQNVVILKAWNLPCSPCGITALEECTMEHQCMRMILPEMVLEEVRKISDIIKMPPNNLDVLKGGGL